MKPKTGPTMKVSELAKALGLDESRVRKLAKSGMPVTSIADAQQWRAKESKRVGRRGPKPKMGGAAPNSAPPPARDAEQAGDELPAGLDPLERLRLRIERQTRMADTTQARFEAAMKADDIPAAKAAGETNNATQKTLIMLETEYQRRLLEAGTILTVDAAVARFQSVMGDLRAFIESGETEFAKLANPDNPARGIVGYRQFKQRLFAHIASASNV